MDWKPPILQCTWITVTDGHVHRTEVLELHSRQMEADTCIFLHAEDASYMENAIVIKSSDNNVEILASFMQEAIMTPDDTCCSFLVHLLD